MSVQFDASGCILLDQDIGPHASLNRLQSPITDNEQAEWLLT
jgi:hypothetical protein